MSLRHKIHAGGRGKREAAFKVAKSLEETRGPKRRLFLVCSLLHHKTPPEGKKKVNQVLIAEDVYYPGEKPAERNIICRYY